MTTLPKHWRANDECIHYSRICHVFLSFFGKRGENNNRVLLNKIFVVRNADYVQFKNGRTNWSICSDGFSIRSTKDKYLNRVQLVAKLIKYFVDRITTWESVSSSWCMHRHTQCIAAARSTFSIRNKYIFIYTFVCAVHMWLVKQTQFYRKTHYENRLRTHAKEENHRHSLLILCGRIVITIPDNSSENFILNFARILRMVIMLHCFRMLQFRPPPERTVDAASPFIIIDDKPSHRLPWR